MNKVIIPGSVKYIEKSAFSFCDDLESVVISEGLESIGADAFAVCKNLKSIKVPSSVMSIGEDAFDSDNVRLVVREGSYAQEIADEIGLPYDFATDP